MASAITSPNGSGHWIGKIIARARPSRSVFCSCEIASYTSTSSFSNGATISSQ